MFLQTDTYLNLKRWMCITCGSHICHTKVLPLYISQVPYWGTELYSTFKKVNYHCKSFPSCLTNSILKQVNSWTIQQMILQTIWCCYLHIHFCISETSFIVFFFIKINRIPWLLDYRPHQKKKSILIQNIDRLLNYIGYCLERLN